MNVRVQFLGQLRTAAGVAYEACQLPDGFTLGEAMRHLAQERGPEVARHVQTADGRVPPTLLIAINGEAVPAGEVAGTVLRPGDTVTLMPPIAGG